MNCPNCLREYPDLAGFDHAHSGCIIGAVLPIIADRGTAIDPAKVRDLDDDAFWDKIAGPMIDWVEAQVRK